MRSRIFLRVVPRASPCSLRPRGAEKEGGRPLWPWCSGKTIRDTSTLLQLTTLCLPSAARAKTALPRYTQRRAPRELVPSLARGVRSEYHTPSRLPVEHGARRVERTLAVMASTCYQTHVPLSSRPSSFARAFVAIGPAKGAIAHLEDFPSSSLEDAMTLARARGTRLGKHGRVASSALCAGCLSAMCGGLIKALARETPNSIRTTLALARASTTTTTTTHLITFSCSSSMRTSPLDRMRHRGRLAATLVARRPHSPMIEPRSARPNYSQFPL